MSRWVPVALVFCAACSSPSDDVFGGGSFEVHSPDWELKQEWFVDGATQNCLDRHHRDWCNEPKIEVGSAREDEGGHRHFNVHAYLPVPASDPRPACMGTAELELIVYLTQQEAGGGQSLWFELHDPAQTAADPNADQGGRVSPRIRGSVGFEEDGLPSASGGKLGELELRGENECEADTSGTVEMGIVWDFDPTVTAGIGDYSLE